MVISLHPIAAQKTVNVPLEYWYWLDAVKGVGPAAFRLLLEQFGDPRAVHEAPISALREVLGVSRTIPTKLAEAIEEAKPGLARAEPFVQRQRALASACGGRILTFGHAGEFRSRPYRSERPTT